MPIYEYSCDRCGVFSQFEPVQSASEPRICPTCGLYAARIMSSFSSGFREPKTGINKFNFNHEQFVNNAKYNIKVCEALSGKSRHDIGDLAKGGSTPANKWKPPDKPAKRVFASGAVGG